MRIAFLGDIALFGRVSADGNPAWKEYFRDVEQLLARVDYVVGNLETPFSKERKTWGAKSAYLCADQKDLEVLKYLHVDAVTLANNHMYDYGKEAFDLTQQLLVEAGIAWFGVNGKEHLLERGNNRIAFTGFCCYSTNPQKCVKYGETGINEFDLAYAESTLKRYSHEGYLNVCAVHAGIEHVNYPSLDTIAVAKRLAATGSMIYYGHHPHVAQTVVKNGNSLIANSLGNFCFDDTYTKTSGDKPLVELSEDNRSSFVLVANIENNEIKDYEIVPIYIGKDKLHVGRGVDEQQLRALAEKMEAMAPEDYESMRREQRMAWIRPRKAARNVMWVMKRLRPRYLELMLTNRINTTKYNKHVREYLTTGV